MPAGERKLHEISETNLLMANTAKLTFAGFATFSYHGFLVITLFYIWLWAVTIRSPEITSLVGVNTIWWRISHWWFRVWRVCGNNRTWKENCCNFRKQVLSTNHGEKFHLIPWSENCQLTVFFAVNRKLEIEKVYEKLRTKEWETRGKWLKTGFPWVMWC